MITFAKTLAAIVAIGIVCLFAAALLISAVTMIVYFFDRNKLQPGGRTRAACLAVPTILYREEEI